MTISLTERAAERVKKLLENRGKGLGLRLAVRAAGCSGYSHALEFADEVRPDDQVFEDKGVRLVVDADSLALLEGTELDYVREGISEAFKFDNPNVKESCGCGSSFSV